MKREITPEEMRDEQIAARTEKRFTAALARLCSGDQQTVASVVDQLSHKLVEGETMERLTVLAVTDKHQVGAVLEQLVHKVLRDAAEVEATKEVEQIERERAADFEEFDRSFVSTPGPWRHLARA
jgi:hypothetical protein